MVTVSRLVNLFSLSPIKVLGQSVKTRCCKDTDKYEVFPRAVGPHQPGPGHLRTSKIGSCVRAKLSSGTALNKQNIAGGTTDPGYWVSDLANLKQDRLNILGLLCLWQIIHNCISPNPWYPDTADTTAPCRTSLMESIQLLPNNPLPLPSAVHGLPACCCRAHILDGSGQSLSSAAVLCLYYPPPSVVFLSLSHLPPTLPLVQLCRANNLIS